LAIFSPFVVLGGQILSFVVLVGQNADVIGMPPMTPPAMPNEIVVVVVVRSNSLSETQRLEIKQPLWLR